MARVRKRSKSKGVPPVKSAPLPSKAPFVKARDLELAALELRRRRKSYRVIADTLGVSLGAAFKAVQRGLAKLNVLIEKEARGLQAQELEALDLAAEAIANRVASGDLDAIKEWLKIHDRRKLLLGIAPTSSTALSSPDGGPVETVLTWGDAGDQAPPKAAAVAGFMVGVAAGEAGDGDDDDDASPGDSPST